MSVSDKTAVVTGAGSTRGIGRATAHALAAAGWNIAVLDLDEAGAKDVADEIAERHGVTAVGVGCDVTDAASVDVALGRRRRRRPAGRCTGQQRRHHLADPLPRGHRRGVGAHLRGERARLVQRHPPARTRHGRARLRADRVPVVGVGRARRRRLRRRRLLGGEGRPARVRPRAGPRARPARRHRQLRRAWSDRHRHHRRQAGRRAGEAGRSPACPVGRKGRAADVADLITYLCREESGYITGATYDVNGGAHIH